MTKEGELRLVEKIVEILGKKRLHQMGFDIPVGPISPREYIALNRLEEKLPSAPDLDKADEMELQKIIESTKKSMEDLIKQFKEQQTLPMRELLGLDKQLRSIRGLLKVEAAKKVQL